MVQLCQKSMEDYVYFCWIFENMYRNNANQLPSKNRLKYELIFIAKTPKKRF